MEPLEPGIQYLSHNRILRPVDLQVSCNELFELSKQYLKYAHRLNQRSVDISGCPGQVQDLQDHLQGLQEHPWDLFYGGFNGL